MPVIVKEMGAKGRGLVATKDMEIGTLIMTENAAVKVRKSFRAAMGDEAFGREIERQMSNLSKEEQEEFSKLTKNKKIMLDPFVPKKYKEIIAIFENNSITEAIPPGGVTFGRGFKESVVVSLIVSRS